MRTNTPDQVITAKALADMHYAEAVIKETLRLRPVAANLVRRANEAFTLGGFQVPKGFLVLASPRATHYIDPAGEGLGRFHVCGWGHRSIDPSSFQWAAWRHSSMASTTWTSRRVSSPSGG